MSDDSFGDGQSADGQCADYSNGCEYGGANCDIFNDNDDDNNYNKKFHYPMRTYSRCSSKNNYYNCESPIGYTDKNSKKSFNKSNKCPCVIM